MSSRRHAEQRPHVGHLKTLWRRVTGIFEGITPHHDDRTRANIPPGASPQDNHDVRKTVTFENRTVQQPQEWIYVSMPKILLTSARDLLEERRSDAQAFSHELNDLRQARRITRRNTAPTTGSGKRLSWTHWPPQSWFGVTTHRGKLSPQVLRRLESGDNVADVLARLLDYIPPLTEDQTVVYNPPARSAQMSLSSPLVARATKIMSGHPDFQDLPLLDQYYEVCRLINLLDEEFDECSREYLDALLMQNAAADQALLDLDEQDTGLSHTSSLSPTNVTMDQHLGVEQEPEDLDTPLQHLQEETILEQAQLFLDEALREIGSQHLQPLAGSQQTIDVSDASQSELQYAQDSRQRVESAPLGQGPQSTIHQSQDQTENSTVTESFLDVMGVLPSPSRVEFKEDILTDMYPTPEEIVENYPWKKIEYERQLNGLHDKKVALEKQCRAKGKTIRIFRNANGIPLARDNKPVNDQRLMTLDRTDRSEIDPFKDILLENLPPGIKAVHITRDGEKSRSSSPTDRENMESSIAQWRDQVPSMIRMAED